MMKTLIATTALIIVAATPALAGNGGASLIKTSSSAASRSESSSVSQGGAGGTGIGYGGNATATGGSASSNSSTTIKEKLQAPGVAGAGLASDVCHGSKSFGASFPGGGLSFGFTSHDDDCVKMQYAAQLAALGHRRQAVQLLINENPMVARAFQAMPMSAGAVIRRRRH